MAAAADESQNHRNLNVVPDSLNMTFVEEYSRKMNVSSGKNYISKGYKYFHEKYLFGLRVSVTEKGSIIKGKCYRSQRKNETPHTLTVELEHKPALNLSWAICSCAIGKGESCGHICGLLYQIAHFKSLNLKVIPEDTAKTSLPQTWHQPRGPKIAGKAVQDIKVMGYTGTKETAGCVSTLYNPLRGGVLDFFKYQTALKNIAPDTLIIPALENTPGTEFVDTHFGRFPKGSIVGVHQKMHSDYVVNLYDGCDFPSLPVTNFMHQNYQFCMSENQMFVMEGLSISKDDIAKFEELTRLQSETKLWFELRKCRITGSKIHRVYKNGDELAIDLRKKSVSTQEMKDGLADEPKAAMSYVSIKKNLVNIYPCGVVVNAWAYWYAASPDRKVYDPSRSPPFGLLEIKCPRKDSIKECKYLKDVGHGQLELNVRFEYYTEVQAQLAVTGLQWCDFFVWCKNDYHLETITFDSEFWQKVKDKTDEFYFTYFI